MNDAEQRHALHHVADSGLVSAVLLTDFRADSREGRS
jgi:hypothetical protein